MSTTAVEDEQPEPVDPIAAYRDAYAAVMRDVSAALITAAEHARQQPWDVTATDMLLHVADALTQQAEAKSAATSERITCNRCGKSVSTAVPVGTIVRAWVECPECVEAEGGGS